MKKTDSKTKTKNNVDKKTTKKSSKNSPDNKPTPQEIWDEMERKAKVKDNIWGVILIAVGIFLFAAIQFNAAGKVGEIINDFFRGMFGMVGLVVPWYLILFGILLLLNKTVHVTGGSTTLSFVMLLMLCLLNSSMFIQEDHIYYDFIAFYKDGILLDSGGLFGMVLSMFIIKYVGKVGLYVIAISVIIVCLLLIINTPVSRGILKMKEKKEKKKAEKELAEAEKAEAQAKKEQEPVDKPMDYSVKTKKKSRPGRRTESVDLAPDVKIDDTFKDEVKFEPKFFSAPDTSKEPDFGFVDFIDTNPFKDIGKSEPEIKISDGSVENTPDSVFDLMKDEDLFKKDDLSDSVNISDGSSGIGLEPNNETNPNLGLDGCTEEKSGFGLDGASEEKKNINQQNNPWGDFSSDEIGKTNNMDSDAEVIPAATMAAGTVAAEQVDKELTNSEAKKLQLKDGDFNKVKKKKNYRKPPLNLLDKPVKVKDKNLNNELREKAITLEKTLQSFNVNAKVVQVTRGPAVTRYEIQPDTGVKVSSIVRLADDIALNLCAKSIRIEAPIPGKAAVGIEVENEKINTVNIGEIIGSREFEEAKSKISFAVGRDITGKSVVSDLKSMPHLLIAGSTGSGKSVCINSIITSLLYKADPEQVKLVLIDPKVVELGNYNGIPHLLLPVVTDPSKAAATLNWAVAEMTKRYKSFAEEQVRDITGYNDKMDSLGDEERRMPQVVIIIDELADLMMAAPSQVEDSICRLAQMARAAGMHLIVATQRPSVDVITGVIKANIPSRIAFAVSSQVDSRTILDMGGAEKLVGKGDMLFSPLGAGKPVRVQGCFISDKEVERVIEFVKAQSEGADYAEDVMEDIDRVNIESNSEDVDELLPEAIECVVNAKKASTSMLQRRFRIGYNRGASIMDEMEKRGIIGPQDGSRPRQVLMTKEELEELKEEKDEI